MPGLSFSVSVFVPPTKVGVCAEHRAALGDRHVVFDRRGVGHPIVTVPAFALSVFVL